MCLRRKTSTQRIRGRGDRPSHPDAANLLLASHVNRYPIVLCMFVLHEQSQGDEQAGTKVTSSKSGIIQDYKVYVMLKALSSDCEDFLRSNLSKPLMAVH